MADPRFFRCAGPFTLWEVAEAAAAEIAATADRERTFVDVAPLDAAGPEHVAFLDNRRYADAFAASRAGACIIHPDLASRAPQGMALLLTKEPYHAYARVAGMFHPARVVEPGIHATAVVDETAALGDGCRIEAGAVIGAKVRMGARCLVQPNAVIGDGVVVGDDCVVGPCASLSHCVVGNRVVINTGVRIGQEGFGFALGPQGYLKVPQLGRVIIEDDVDIGANTTIDRGAGPDTVIGRGTIIDNLVQIAHNVKLGRGCVIVAHVGISGSTHVGDYVMIGGQAGLAGHLTVGHGARIGAQAGVMKNLPAGITVLGSPALPNREYWRQIVTLAALGKKKQGD